MKLPAGASKFQQVEWTLENKESHLNPPDTSRETEQAHVNEFREVGTALAT